MFEFPEAPEPFQLPHTVDRLNWQLAVLGWSNNELARRTEVSQAKATAWVNGKSFMPNQLAVWLETLTQANLALGRPLLWDRDPTVSAERHEHSVNSHRTAWSRAAPESE